MNNNADLFLDCFTENEGRIELDVNHLTVGCISSKQNKFNLDEEGNLTVKTITATNQELGGGGGTVDYPAILKMVYPVGSIYLSVNSVNPGGLFGGTWTAFGTGRALVGIDASQAEFNAVEKTGGNKNLQQHTHTASTDSTGAHTHNVKWRAFANMTANTNGTFVLRRNDAADASDGTNAAAMSAGAHTHAVTVANAGTGTAQNLQPYITCYMWKRTA